MTDEYRFSDGALAGGKRSPIFTDFRGTGSGWRTRGRYPRKPNHDDFIAVFPVSGCVRDVYVQQIADMSRSRVKVGNVEISPEDRIHDNSAGVYAPWGQVLWMEMSLLPGNSVDAPFAAFFIESESIKNINPGDKTSWPPITPIDVRFVQSPYIDVDGNHVTPTKMRFPARLYHIPQVQTILSRYHPRRVEWSLPQVRGKEGIHQTGLFNKSKGMKPPPGYRYIIHFPTPGTHRGSVDEMADMWARKMYYRVIGQWNTFISPIRLTNETSLRMWVPASKIPDPWEYALMPWDDDPVIAPPFDLSTDIPADVRSVLGGGDETGIVRYYFPDTGDQFLTWLSLVNRLIRPGGVWKFKIFSKNAVRVRISIIDGNEFDEKGYNVVNKFTTITIPDGWSDLSLPSLHTSVFRDERRIPQEKILRPQTLLTIEESFVRYENKTVYGTPWNMEMYRQGVYSDPNQTRMYMMVIEEVL